MSPFYLIVLHIQLIQRRPVHHRHSCHCHWLTWRVKVKVLGRISKHFGSIDLRRSIDWQRLWLYPIIGRSHIETEVHGGISKAVVLAMKRSVKSLGGFWRSLALALNWLRDCGRFVDPNDCVNSIYVTQWMIIFTSSSLPLILASWLAGWLCSHPPCRMDLFLDGNSILSTTTTTIIIRP